MAKVSIITPVYNTEKYINTALDSTINQTLKDLEIILIDDGSSDCSGLICDEYAQKDERIKVIHQENRGAGISRNKGIEIATGEYIVFLDSDDYIEPETAEELYNIAEKEKVDFINFGFKLYENNCEHISIDYKTEPNKVIDRKGITDYLSDFRVEHINLNAGKFIRRDFLINNNIRFVPGLQVQEDFVFVTEMMLKANSIYFVPKIYYNYYKRDDSLTTKKDRDGIYKQFNEAYLRIKNIYNETGLFGYEERLINYFSRYLLSSIKREKYHKVSFSARTKEIKNICNTELYNDVSHNLESVKKNRRDNYYALKLVVFLVKIKQFWFINILIFALK